MLTQLAIWVGGGFLASLALNRALPGLGTGRVRDWIKNTGTVGMFGYYILATVLVLLVDYYVGFLMLSLIHI